jgi:hypothetical protein
MSDLMDEQIDNLQGVVNDNDVSEDKDNND